MHVLISPLFANRLRPSLSDTFLPRTVLRTNASPVIDALVDAYVTPDGLAALIANPNVIKNMRAPQAPQQLPAFKGIDWSNVRYAFFTSPRVFVVDREGIKLRFRFTGFGWRLNKLDLGLGPAKR